MNSDETELKFHEDGSVDLSNFRKSFSDVSRNDAGKSVVQSDHQVIYFDAVVGAHCSYRRYKYSYKSTDALYLEGKDKDPWFIEFKSGIGKNIRGEDLKGKACESLLIAMDLGLLSGLRDAQKRAHYIFVYDQETIGSHDNVFRYSSGNPNKPHLLGKIKNLHWLFCDINSYTPEEFVRYFIIPHYGSSSAN